MKEGNTELNNIGIQAHWLKAVQFQVWSSLIAQLVKNPPAIQFDSWVGKICWGSDRLPTLLFLGFPCDSAGKESACNVGNLGSIPDLGRSPGEKGKATHSNILAWRILWTTVHGVAKSWTLLSDFHFQS